LIDAAKFIKLSKQLLLLDDAVIIYRLRDKAGKISTQERVKMIEELKKEIESVLTGE